MRIKKKRTKTGGSVHKELVRIVMIVAAAFVYAIIINNVIVPAGLYTGGILGIGQLLRSFLVQFIDVSRKVDISGAIFYVINIPFLILARKWMGKLYLWKSVLCITLESVFLVLLPIPANPIVSNTLVCALIGGAFSGCMMGVMLQMGASDGGMDLIGVLLVHRIKGITVGMANLIVNLLVFSVMALHHDVEIVVYSVLCSMAMSYGIDRFFFQNINVELHVVMRENPEKLERMIHKEFRRTLTKWEGRGSYSGEQHYILYILMDKFESRRFRRMVREYDPTAFIVENPGVIVNGNFERHFG